MSAVWHRNFVPKALLASVDVGALLARCGVDAGSEVAGIASPCVVCGRAGGAGLRLNDGAFVCAPCFDEICRTEYPERYEAQRRQHVAELHAWTTARLALARAVPWPQLAGLASAGIVVAVILIWVKLAAALAVGILSAAIHVVAERRQQRRMDAWAAQFPQPLAPELVHFHDPHAELTSRDRLFLRVFDHWPGYPPYWKYLRDVVLQRDGGRCQVTGCPSRLELHVHHRQAVSLGGRHAPENLVTLCEFHHAIEPEPGHERIWTRLQTRYFTLVREHERRNRATAGAHVVRPHVRRLELASTADLAAVVAAHQLACAACGAALDGTAVSLTGTWFVVPCPACDQTVEVLRELAEESCPRLAEGTQPTVGLGTWRARWDVLTDRKDAMRVRTTSAADRRTRAAHRVRASELAGRPRCPKCDAAMRIVRPRPGDAWRAFWGCTRFRTDGCRGSVSIEP